MPDRRLLLLLLCCSALLPGLAQQKLLPYQVKADPRMINSAGTEIYLLRARPAKLFNWQGQPVNGGVEVLNNTDAAKTLTVRAWITNGLDTVAGKQEKVVEVPAFSKGKVDFTWAATDVAPYGHAMAFEVVQDGKVIATAEDFFSSADNVWAVGVAGGHPVGFTAEHVKDMAGIEASVERFRERYTNTFEKFFWAPDDFADMTPTAEKWYSGQARYHEQLDRLKRMCEYGVQIGVLPTTYGKSIGSGSGARDVIREHPELINGFGGVMSFNPDTEELAKWDKESTPYWQSVGWAHYNMNDPAVVGHGINELVESTKMFGWSGVRFDGHFRASTGKQRVGDKFIDFTADMADAQTAANQRALKDAIWKLDPRYVFGYNYGECDFSGRLIDNPRETVELCADGGHIMDEYAKGNAGASHPFRQWTTFAHAMVKSAEQARRLGGHYFPMVSNGPVGRYQTIFTYAAGAHPNGVPWSTDNPYNAFATRYAGVLWDKALHNVWNPCGLVIVAPGVLWEDYVREQAVDATHKRLIIHLINPPAQETATETQAAQDELNRREKRRYDIKVAADKVKAKPDYSELDKLPPVQFYPPVKADIPVRIVPRALGGSWQITRALLLDPETATATPLNVDASERYFSQVRVPALKFWSVLVVDLEGKGN